MKSVELNNKITTINSLGYMRASSASTCSLCGACATCFIATFILFGVLGPTLDKQIDNSK